MKHHNAMNMVQPVPVSNSHDSIPAHTRGRTTTIKTSKAALNPCACNSTDRPPRARQQQQQRQHKLSTGYAQGTHLCQQPCRRNVEVRDRPLILKSAAWKQGFSAGGQTPTPVPQAAHLAQTNQRVVRNQQHYEHNACRQTHRDQWYTQPMRRISYQLRPKAVALFGSAGENGWDSRPTKTGD